MKNIITVSALVLALAACSSEGGNTEKHEEKQSAAPYSMSTEALADHIKVLDPA